MKEKYIVYYRNASNKLFEADTKESAIAFVERANWEKRNNGDDEFEKYEIVRVVR